jgi:hypothetical protein
LLFKNFRDKIESGRKKLLKLKPMNSLALCIFLAQFWGLLIFIISLIYLLKGKKGINELVDLVENKGLLSFWGYLALILGLVTINLCNVWKNDWRLLVTLFGWLSTFKGIFILAFPRWTSKICSFYQRQPLVGIFLLILALVISLWLIWISGTYLPQS